jgi:hypothetical protein
MDDDELYDLIIPPGVSKSIIEDVLRNFDVDIVEREMRIVYAVGEQDDVIRNVLAFRGSKELLLEVEEFIKQSLIDKIDNMGSDRHNHNNDDDSDESVR